MNRLNRSGKVLLLCVAVVLIALAAWGWSAVAPKTLAIEKYLSKYDYEVEEYRRDEGEVTSWKFTVKDSRGEFLAGIIISSKSMFAEIASESDPNDSYRDWFDIDYMYEKWNGDMLKVKSANASLKIHDDVYDEIMDVLDAIRERYNDREEVYRARKTWE